MGNTPKHITILGGSGFVGTQLCAELHRCGYRIRVITRQASKCRDLAVIPSVEIRINQGFDENVLCDLFRGTDIVINLIGILNEHGHRGKGFFFIHTELSQRVLRACQTANVPRLLHMSALNANPDGPSYYLRSKGQAENYLLTFAGDRTHVTIFRPSVIFGANDSFTNRFATLLKLAPVLPLACPNARFAPVFVGDVVQTMVASINNAKTYDKKIELCGPHIYTLKEIVHQIARQCGLRRLIIGLPQWASKMQAQVLEYFPGKPFSLDNFNSLKVDSVCLQETACKTSMESIMPTYLSPRSDKREN